MLLINRTVNLLAKSTLQNASNWEMYSSLLINRLAKKSVCTLNTNSRNMLLLNRSLKVFVWVHTSQILLSYTFASLYMFYLLVASQILYLIYMLVCTYFFYTLLASTHSYIKGYLSSHQLAQHMHFISKMCNNEAVHLLYSSQTTNTIRAINLNTLHS